MNDPTATGGRRRETRPTRPTDNRDELLARAMKDARWELTAKLGKDIDTWSWGRLHQLMLKNQTLGTDGPGFMQWLLNRGPWNLGGGEAAVNATGWNAAGGYDVIWVPSMRMVVNLDDLDKSRWINLTGASGHAYSAHYTDQTDKWAKGELLKWPFSEKAVAKAHRGPDGPHALTIGTPRSAAPLMPVGARSPGVPVSRLFNSGCPEAVYSAGVTAASTGWSCASPGHGRPPHRRTAAPPAPAVRPRGRQPGEHPVVAAAAAPQPQSAPVHREPRQQHRVGLRDRLRAEACAGRLAAARARPRTRASGPS